MFFKIGALKNFANFYRKTPVLDSLFNKVAGPQACSFIKKRLQHRCFPVKFAKLLRTPFFTEHLRWQVIKASAYLTSLVTFNLAKNTWVFSKSTIKTVKRC